MQLQCVPSHVIVEYNSDDVQKHSASVNDFHPSSLPHLYVPEDIAVISHQDRNSIATLINCALLRYCNDVVFADLSQPLPFRRHVFDAAISVACIHYLCTPGRSVQYDHGSGLGDSKEEHVVDCHAQGVDAEVEPKSCQGTEPPRASLGDSDHHRKVSKKTGIVIRTGEERCRALLEYPIVENNFCYQFFKHGAFPDEDAIGKFLIRTGCRFQHHLRQKNDLVDLDQMKQNKQKHGVQEHIRLRLVKDFPHQRHQQERAFLLGSSEGMTSSSSAGRGGLQKQQGCCLLFKKSLDHHQSRQLVPETSLKEDQEPEADFQSLLQILEDDYWKSKKRKSSAADEQENISAATSNVQISEPLPPTNGSTTTEKMKLDELFLNFADQDPSLRDHLLWLVRAYAKHASHILRRAKHLSERSRGAIQHGSDGNDHIVAQEGEEHHHASLAAGEMLRSKKRRRKSESVENDPNMASAAIAEPPRTDGRLSSVELMIYEKIKQWQDKTYQDLVNSDEILRHLMTIYHHVRCNRQLICTSQARSASDG